MSADPKRIKRVGLAVEMEDGELITLYTESPTAEILIENKTEFEHWYDGMVIKPILMNRETEVTISGIRKYRIERRAPEATAQAIDRIHEITEGNPNDHR